MRPISSLITSLLLGASLLTQGACEHSGIGITDPGHPDGPLNSAVPTRLTYSGSGARPSPADPLARRSREVAWATDPDRIVYAFGHIAKSGEGRPRGCIGDLPAIGGARAWDLCDREVARIDTGTTAEWPAMRDDGEVAFVRRRFGPYSGFPYYSDYAIQRTAPGEVARSLFTFPQPSPTNGQLIQGIAFPAWIDHAHLIALARMIKRSATDLLQTGLEVVRIETGNTADPFTPIPGTLYASSVALGATADTIYYTIGGDSRVYRRALSSGAVDTVFDFDSLGIARDVRVGPDLLIAVVGGAVAFGPDSLLGMAQVDGGGPLYRVQLSTGTVALLGATFDFWQHPALAPDGSALIVEQGEDLWRIPLP